MQYAEIEVKLSSIMIFSFKLTMFHIFAMLERSKKNADSIFFFNFREELMLIIAQTGFAYTTWEIHYHH